MVFDHLREIQAEILEALDPGPIGVPPSWPLNVFPIAKSVFGRKLHVHGIERAGPAHLTEVGWFRGEKPVGLTPTDRCGEPAESRKQPTQKTPLANRFMAFTPS